MKETRYLLKITFVQPLLGGAPDKNVATNFLARKAPGGEIPEDELESAPEGLDKGTTGFHRFKNIMGPDGKPAPLIYCFHMLGYFKYMAKSVLNGQYTGARGKPILALGSKVSTFMTVMERQILLHSPTAPVEVEVELDDDDARERSLRAETMRGDRVCLAKSEQLPAGTWFECTLAVLGDVITQEMIEDMLALGEHFGGIGQWRGSKKFGAFTYELTKIYEGVYGHTAKKGGKDGVEEAAEPAATA